MGRKGSPAHGDGGGRKPATIPPPAARLNPYVMERHAGDILEATDSLPHKIATALVVCMDYYGVPKASKRGQIIDLERYNEDWALCRGIMFHEKDRTPGDRWAKLDFDDQAIIVASILLARWPRLMMAMELAYNYGQSHPEAYPGHSKTGCWVFKRCTCGLAMGIPDSLDRYWAQVMLANGVESPLVAEAFRCLALSEAYKEPVIKPYSDRCAQIK